MIKAMFER